ncbi:hypothetical protein FRC10_010176, partial [Ceratobasidium sp. 414]
TRFVGTKPRRAPSHSVTIKFEMFESQQNAVRGHEAEATRFVGTKPRRAPSHSVTIKFEMFESQQNAVRGHEAEATRFVGTKPRRAPSHSVTIKFEMFESQQNAVRGYEAEACAVSFCYGYGFTAMWGGGRRSKRHNRTRFVGTKPGRTPSRSATIVEVAV